MVNKWFIVVDLIVVNDWFLMVNWLIISNIICHVVSLAMLNQLSKVCCKK